MKLMSYNIWDGAPKTFKRVVQIVRDEKADYVTINEANTFAQNDNEMLKKFAKDCSFPYFDIALSGELDFHVAVFSKYSLKNVVKLKPLERACLIAQVDTPLGEISIASLHLTPLTQDESHPEMDLILDFQQGCKSKILMGDMNSLSFYDRYNESMTDGFDAVQIKKFVRNGRLRYDAIRKIESIGYFDTALLLNRNTESTVPTLGAQQGGHVKMRLDYIFVSKELKKRVVDYEVIKNELTENASDHYPVVVVLE